MPIHPLPQFEADVAEYLKEKEDREAYERLNAPKTIVVRFGFMKMVGEFPYRGDAKPGCGSKIVVRTHRGTEIGEMLTSTCPNSGCSKSVSRKEMLDYIQNSGGRDYPFYSDGKAIRVATAEDMNEQSRIEQSKHGIKMEARRVSEELGLPIKIVEAEPILGGERLTIFYASEDRPDLRELHDRLGALHASRVDLRQVGARDEARLTADYEKCGQYCCCKNFLKVLKPVSMRSAKVQKATLDPLKISGRCGRLMCCLRYEDQTYDELRKNLPHRKSRVGTPDGDGTVVETQILTQLALVQLDADGQRVAVPVEDLTEPGTRKAPEPKEEPKRDAGRGPRREPRRPRPERGERPARKAPAETEDAPSAEGTGSGEAPAKKKRRRRRRKGSGTGAGPAGAEGGAGNTGGTPRGEESRGPESSGGESAGDGQPKKKRRRRRRRKGGGGSGGGEGGSDASDSGGGPGAGSDS
ncbi:MAG: regulatory iron-sulfur-containing complex subunit RicT [Planctomycetota bacterium]